jgi:WD40 repeat protein
MLMYTVQKLVFLDQRATQRSAAQLVSCGSGGWVRFWNIDTSQCMAEFVAHSGVATIVAMATDVDNTVLATGGPNGDAKLWDIKLYCMRSESHPPRE